jgi:hypothetical protein
VEVCGNDVCATGITALQHTLDVPVAPGGLIVGKARAHAGDAASPWAVVQFTLPAHPVDVFAHFRVNQQETERVQYRLSSIRGADPATVILESAPTQGNLLVAVVSERSGTSHNAVTLSGGGWTIRTGADVALTNTTERMSMAVATKVAGAGESATITAHNGTNSLKWLTVEEYAQGSGGVWEYVGGMANSTTEPNRTGALSTGAMAPYSGSDFLMVSAIAVKFDGVQALTSFVAHTAEHEVWNMAPANNGMAIGVGYTKPVSPILTDTLSWAATDRSPRSVVAGILVFRLTAER